MGTTQTQQEHTAHAERYWSIQRVEQRKDVHLVITGLKAKNVILFGKQINLPKTFDHLKSVGVQYDFSWIYISTLLQLQLYNLGKHRYIY